MATGLVAGSAFGAAMAISGVAQPQVIANQFSFQDWHMLQTFLAASTTSSFVIALLDSTGYARQTPRSPSTLGFFAYDGNIIGGSLLGTGMALTGSCPGSVFVQLGLGAPNSLTTFSGALLGGVLFTICLNPIIESLRRRHVATSSETSAQCPPTLTLYERLGISRTVGVSGFMAATLGAAIALNRIMPASPYVHGVSPLLGGLLIGLSQMISILLRKSLLGVSGSFEEMGKTVRSALTLGKYSLPSYANFRFATGAAVGAFLVALAMPELGNVVPVERVTTAAAFIGGASMIIGSRIAGGCTSGHGLSGMSMMSLSSFITIGSAFGMAGILGTYVL
ncbi:hypothetical protein BROUX41_001505 [Berkeleyomyces rouxiae]|uniref:uncharacterized protein n=1 Tax=Berkeleyomyces rouxiae TaxID=2035830 RepID=UPI003B805DCA